ncbi:MAG: isoprenylcysteine carboxylmethyltransferase family protein [Parachlamydiaceae bacterium]|nr:isoprenylcysteine carboxylmethyltransferase family protein [Parachlamydiaceae bacterium]
MLCFASIFSSDYINALCDYICWVVSFNGASRLLWLSVLWFILELIIRIIARINISPQINNHEAESKDKGSWWLIALASSLMSGMILLVLHMRWDSDLPGYLFPIGISLMILGLALRIYAVVSLGKFFTMKVIIFSNHHLVMDGPYKWLRHPSYTGILIATIGFGIASGYLMVLFAFLVLLFFALGYRIYVEEKALGNEFGDEWFAYTTTRWMILPWIL